MIEVRIGVVESPKELSLEIEEEADAVRKTIDTALNGSDTGMLWMTDKEGKLVGVPISKIAYVEIEPRSERSVGFAP